MNSLVVVAVCAFALCLHSAQALTYGGGTCSFATSGVAACTSTAAGFCSVDTVAVANSPVTAITVTGKCICYPNYSGTVCGTQTVTSTSTTTASSNNALGVLALGALAAAALSGFGSGASGGLGGSGDLSGSDLLYLQQIQGFQG
ncbi:uncharacterized protein LOC134269142 [Saccostrea cucullata]|uniref:uncharacterized protein LOC134269142 n=1 Tax=Saccostrea cuccullata TaxID=36930 RepID=UPI002ED0385D